VLLLLYSAWGQSELTFQPIRSAHLLPISRPLFTERRTFSRPIPIVGPVGGHPILFLSREKVRKNKIFKNNELKTSPLFWNTSTSESTHGSPLVSTNLSPITNSESKRYQYPVCHTRVATQHPLSRFQSPATPPGRGCIVPHEVSIEPPRWCSGSSRRKI